MLGVLVNSAAIVIGSLIGILCKKGIPEKISQPIMKGIGLCVIYIGISGALCGENTLILIISTVLGVIVGTLLDLDGKFNRLGDALEKRYAKNGEQGDFSRGFVSASILFCVGAMAVVGSINAGLGDHTVLYTKATLDGISSVIFSASMGIGVMFSAIPILIYQGLIALFAGALQGVLTETAINEMSCVGYVLIMGIGFNLVGMTKLKIADFMPAIIIAPILAGIVALF